MTKIFISLIVMGQLAFGMGLIPTSITNTEEKVVKVDQNKTNKIEESSLEKSLAGLNEIVLKIRDGAREEIDPDKMKDLEKLYLKESLNKAKGFKTAANRDKLSIFMLENIVFYKTMINDLIDARKSFKDEDYIKGILLAFTKNIHTTEGFEKLKGGDKISQDYNLNLEKLKVQTLKYNQIAFYLSNNISKIKTENILIRYVNPEVMFTYINKIPVVKALNPYLEYFLGVDIGRTIAAFFAVFVVMLLRFIIVPGVSKIASLYTPPLKASSHIDFKNLVVGSVKTPVNIVLWMFSFQIFIEVIASGVFNIELFRDFQSIMYMFAFLLIINNVINAMIESFSEGFLDKFKDARKEFIIFFNKLLKIIFVIIFSAYALTKMGVNITAILGGIGMLSIGASLALKDTFSNFIGTVNIIFDKTFNTGDWVWTEKFEGTVIEVGMRKTRLRAFGNQEWTVSNAYLSNATILNHSQRKIGRRIKMSIELTYNSQPEDIKAFTKDLKEYLMTNSNIATERSVYKGVQKSSKLIKKEDDLGIKKTLLVYLDELDESSINVLVYAFSESTNWEDWLKTKEDVIYTIMDLVKKNNLDFAFPTQVNILEGIHPDSQLS